MSGGDDKRLKFWQINDNGECSHKEWEVPKKITDLYGLSSLNGALISDKTGELRFLSYTAEPE